MKRTVCFLGSVLTIVVAGAAQSFAQRGAKETPIAIVNGDEIPYSWYERARLTRLRNIGKSEGDTAALDAMETDAIFLSLIDDALTRQEARKRGIVVTRAEAAKLLENNPPGYIRDIFTDPKGAFRRDLLKSVIEKPREILKFVGDPAAPKQKIVQEWEDDINHLLRYFQSEETRRRLTDTLYAAAPLTDAEVKWRYFAERTIVDGSVVCVLHTTVPDSMVTVTDGEIQDWYDKHKEEYRIPETRYLSSLIFPVIPSSEDSAMVRDKVNAAVKSIESTPLSRRLERVDKIIATLPPNRIPVGRTISPQEFTGQIRNDLVNAKKGDILGPYPVEKESLLLYVADDQPSRDTLVRARQILLPVRPDMTPEQKAQQRHVAELLRDSIDNEPEFIEAANFFEADPEKSGTGGELGYGERGRYVPEFDSALFAAPKGVVVGPIETRFGYHLIWVIDRQAREFSLRELRFPINASETVHERVMKDAKEYARFLRTGQPLDSIQQVMKLRYPGLVVDSGSILKRMEPYGDILATNEFIFRAQVGDVGIIPLPFDRIAVLELGYVWQAGIPSFKDVIAYPTAHARRKKQLDLLEKKLGDLAEYMTPDMLLGPIREKAPMAEVYLLKKQPIITMPDEDPVMLDSLLTVTDNGEVTGPVRGKHGLYFLRVATKFGPAERDFQRDKSSYEKDYRARYRKELLEKTILEARHYADIEDTRGTLNAVSDHGR